MSSIGNKVNYYKEYHRYPSTKEERIKRTIESNKKSTIDNLSSKKFAIFVLPLSADHNGAFYIDAVKNKYLTFIQNSPHVGKINKAIDVDKVKITKDFNPKLESLIVKISNFVNKVEVYTTEKVSEINDVLSKEESSLSGVLIVSHSAPDRMVLNNSKDSNSFVMIPEDYKEGDTYELESLIMNLYESICPNGILGLVGCNTAGESEYFEPLAKKFSKTLAGEQKSSNTSDIKDKDITVFGIEGEFYANSTAFDPFLSISKNWHPFTIAHKVYYGESEAEFLGRGEQKQKDKEIISALSNSKKNTYYRNTAKQYISGKLQQGQDFSNLPLS